MNIIPAAEITSSGLDAQKRALSTVMENIANQHTTKDADGKAYRAKNVTFESVMNENGAVSVKVAGDSRDETAGSRIFNPSHPHADDDGYVELSNVNVAKEMSKMIQHSRGYEAGTVAFKNAVRIAEAGMSIGRD